MIAAFSCRMALERHSIDQLKQVLSARAYVWVDVLSPTKDELSTLSELFKLHPLTVEDILSDIPRVKYEEFENYTFVMFYSLKAVSKATIEYIPISFIIGKNFLITSHNQPAESIKLILEKEKRLTDLLCKGPDYLMHHLLDVEVDRYLPVVTNLYHDVMQLDNEISETPSKKFFDELFDVKRHVWELKLVAVPAIDVFSRIAKRQGNYVRSELEVYFSDVYDHVIRINHILSTTKEQILNTISESSAMASNRMNDIIRVLTIFSTIVLPLSLLTGFYGMNVAGLPMGDSWWHIGVVMIAVVGGMLYFFRNKGWI